MHETITLRNFCGSGQIAEIHRREDGSIYVTFSRADLAYPKVELDELRELLRRAEALRESSHA